MKSPGRDEKVSRIVFTVRGIDCATCAVAIEKQVKKVEGVKRVGTALMLNKVFVDYDETKADPSAITEAVRRSGYGNHVVGSRKVPPNR